MNRTTKERLESIREAEKRNAEHEAEWKEANGDVQTRQDTDHEAQRSPMDCDS